MITILYFLSEFVSTTSSESLLSMTNALEAGIALAFTQSLMGASGNFLFFCCVEAGGVEMYWDEGARRLKVMGEKKVP